MKHVNMVVINQFRYGTDIFYEVCGEKNSGYMINCEMWMDEGVRSFHFCNKVMQFIL